MKSYRWSVKFAADYVVVYASSRHDAMILACAKRINEGLHYSCGGMTQWDGGKIIEEWTGKFALRIKNP